MKTLVLGHHRNYTKQDIRCSPIDIDEWYDDDYICVDLDKNADIIHDLRQPWIFADDNSYDRIIDCGGIAFTIGNRFRLNVQQEIERTLKPGGVAYGRNIIINK